MYVVIILEEALEDLRSIVAYISNENSNAAETLGRELLDQAMSLESFPSRGSRVSSSVTYSIILPREFSSRVGNPCSVDFVDVKQPVFGRDSLPARPELDDGL
jgi:plasmid stabilization system protein ParE